MKRKTRKKIIAVIGVALALVAVAGGVVLTVISGDNNPIVDNFNNDQEEGDFVSAKPNEVDRYI